MGANMSAESYEDDPGDRLTRSGSPKDTTSTSSSFQNHADMALHDTQSQTKNPLALQIEIPKSRKYEAAATPAEDTILSEASDSPLSELASGDLSPPPEFQSVQDEADIQESIREQVRSLSEFEDQVMADVKVSEEPTEKTKKQESTKPKPKRDASTMLREAKRNIEDDEKNTSDREGRPLRKSSRISKPAVPRGATPTPSVSDKTPQVQRFRKSNGQFAHHRKARTSLRRKAKASDVSASKSKQSVAPPPANVDTEMEDNIQEGAQQQEKIQEATPKDSYQEGCMISHLSPPQMLVEPSRTSKNGEVPNNVNKDVRDSNLTRMNGVLNRQNFVPRLEEETSVNTAAAQNGQIPLTINKEHNVASYQSKLVPISTPGIAPVYLHPSTRDQKSIEASIQTQARAIAPVKLQVVHNQTVQGQNPGNGFHSKNAEAFAAVTAQQKLIQLNSSPKESKSPAQSAKAIQYAGTMRSSRPHDHESNAAGPVSRRSYQRCDNPIDSIGNENEALNTLNLSENLPIGEQIANAIYIEEQMNKETHMRNSVVVLHDGEESESDSGSDERIMEINKELRRSTLAEDMLRDVRKTLQDIKGKGPQVPDLYRPLNLSKLALTQLRLLPTPANIGQYSNIFMNDISGEKEPSLEICTFCAYTGDLGITDSTVWLPREAYPEYCNDCSDFSNTFAQELHSLGYICPGALTTHPNIDSLNSIAQSETLTGRRIFGSVADLLENNGHPLPGLTRYKDEATGKDVTRYQAVQTCRAHPWGQVDCRKAVICEACKREKFNIIKHRQHLRFAKIEDLKMRIDQWGYEIPQDPREKMCMICFDSAYSKCAACPLRLCVVCETLLTIDCKGFLNSLFCTYGNKHLKNDAFLLRSDGGGF